MVAIVYGEIEAPFDLHSKLRRIFSPGKNKRRLLPGALVFLIY